MALRRLEKRRGQESSIAGPSGVSQQLTKQTSSPVNIEKRVPTSSGGETVAIAHTHIPLGVHSGAASSPGRAVETAEIYERSDGWGMDDPEDWITILTEMRNNVQHLAGSFMYNPSFSSSETSIASYKTERTINSRKSRYNALPRRKYADIGHPQGLRSLDYLDVDVPMVCRPIDRLDRHNYTNITFQTVSGQRPRVLVPRLDVVPLQVTVQNPILNDSEASTEVGSTPRDPLLPILSIQSDPEVSSNHKHIMAQVSDNVYVKAHVTISRTPW